MMVCPHCGADTDEPVKPRKPKRSVQQLRYWFGVPMKALSEVTGYTKMQCHLLCLSLCFGVVIDRYTGRDVPVVAFSRGLTKKHFSELMEWFPPWAWEMHQISVPMPNEVDMNSLPGCDEADGWVGREVRMTTLPKPVRAASAERRQRRARIETQERTAKLAAKVRDGHRCQFPGCGVTPVEAMHEVDKGIGGDGGRFSCRPEHFTSGCAEHHRGRRSVHSAHVAFHRHPGDFVSWWTRESLGEPLTLLAVTDKYGHVTDKSCVLTDASKGA